MRRNAAGFSLMETMIVVLVVAIAAVAILPSSSSEAPVSLQAASGSLAADLEYAQAQSVSHPDDPVVVVVDPAHNKYHLARASSPETPIDRPGSLPGTPYEVALGEGADDAAISLTAAGVGSHIRFDSMGRLQQESDIVLTLLNSAGRVDVFISAQTGDVAALGDASKDAVVTQAVYTVPAEQPPAQQPAQAAQTNPLSETVEAVDSLISGDVSRAVSTTTGTVAGVTVGVVSATTTVVEATTTTVTNTTTTVTNTVTNTVGGLLGGKK